MGRRGRRRLWLGGGQSGRILRLSMKVLIYGGGSVGLGIASCLLKSGAEVDIVARKDTVSALEVGGLRRTGIFGDYSAEAGAFGSFASLDEMGESVYDFVLVCTKSFDSLAAAKDISRHKFLLGEQTRIVLFQNGWGNAQIFAAFFESGRIYNARVITGFSRQEKNEVVVTVHADAIHVGSLFGGDLASMEDLCRLIADGDIGCEVTKAIEKDLWSKMLYNCALNPLGAVLDVPYGVLGEHEYTREIMNGVAGEVFAVMGVAGYRTHWPEVDGFLEVFYAKLVPFTAKHKSSTLQDILAKRETEIEALNGAVIELAKEHGISVPYNLAVYNMVKFIEERNA